MIEERKWVFCPCCGVKTRLQLVRQTELRSFPLFCPKCRKETMIDARHFRVSVAGNKIIV
ncbi:MAG: cysteine-rich KTR domain-containing protein [Clostridiales bacterium]|nr:cysteine-rich KTR domain-containing protein [Clostridiales bacterium]MCI6937776.1 cysteine-rich KTR domain-containing protein [Clostridiales bacterium]